MTYLIDNYPTCVAEAEALKKKGFALSKVVVVDTPDDELVRLSAGRRIDRQTQTMYHCEYACTSMGAGRYMT